MTKRPVPTSGFAFRGDEEKEKTRWDEMTDSLAFALIVGGIVAVLAVLILIARA